MINLYPVSNAIITAIDCGSPSGTSLPLSGSINISEFTNLTGFSCTGGHNIQSFTGNVSCPNLKSLVLTENLLSQFPNLNNNTLLEELRLDNNNISGIVPSLYYLSGLKIIRLQENRLLSGTLPSLTGGLTGVKSFYNIGCSMSGNIVLNDVITDYRCDSQNGSIKIGGILPPLPASLSIFYVYNNKISGGLPSMTNNIQEFKCYNNLLTGFTNNISTASKLQYYHIGNNKISGEILLGPKTSVFKYYDISSNYITGFIPSTLNTWPNLRLFSCQDNYISGSIPTLPLSIVDFNCGSQSGTVKITGFIPPLITYTNLNVWHSNQNQISGSIPTLPNSITDFLCHGNYMTGFIPTLISNVNLDRFNCGNNNISGMIPDLSGNKKLTIFKAYINNLTGYAGTSLPPTLTEISLNDNYFKQPAIDSFLVALSGAQSTLADNSPYLVYGSLLELDGNNMSSPGISGRDAIKYLTGRNNQGWWQITTGMSVIS
jgi:hypothetical protein